MGYNVEMEEEEKPEKPKTEYRISMGMSVFLIIIAGVFELIGLVPILGSFSATIFWFCVGVYFWSKGMGIFSPKKLVTIVISYVIEIIPIVQWLPALIIGIIVYLIIVRMEDKTGLSLLDPIKKGVTPPRVIRVPKNNDGLRLPNSSTGQSNPDPKSQDATQTEQIEKNNLRAVDEIGELRTNVEQWKNELQQLDPQISKYTQEKKDFRNQIAEVIKRKKQEGISDEELTKWERTYLSGSMETGTPDEIRKEKKIEYEKSEEINLLRFKANQLRDAIWRTNNQIIELETTLKKQ